VHAWIIFKNKHFAKKNLTCVSEAPGTNEPVFLYSSKMFFSSAFSALNYKYNNININALFGTHYITHTFSYLTCL
jgi:hypothetical protein